MRNKPLLAALLVLLCVLSLGFRYQSARQWEYKFEQAPSEKKANDLGSQGWELVAIQSPSQNIPAPTFVFRRAKN
jgi:hypothetical protein